LVVESPPNRTSTECAVTARQTLVIKHAGDYLNFQVKLAD